MKRKRVTVEDIFCMPVWETEIEWCVKHYNMDEETARAIVIIRWMEEGDLRPLARHLGAGHINPVVCDQLIQMINHRELEVVRKRGSPKKPELFAQAIMAARAYDGRKGPSAVALEQIAAEQHRSVKAIEAAITGVRKREA